MEKNRIQTNNLEASEKKANEKYTHCDKSFQGTFYRLFIEDPIPINIAPFEDLKSLTLMPLLMRPDNSFLASICLQLTKSE